MSESVQRLELNESTLAHAAVKLGGAEFHDLTLYCGFPLQGTALRLKNAGYVGSYVLIPAELLKSPFAWAVKHGNETFVNDGT